MAVLENLGLALATLLAIVTLVRTPVGFKGTVFWAWAWLFQIAAGLSFSTDRMVIGIVLSTFFPLFQLIGVLYFTNRALPSWLIPAGLVVALLKGLNASADEILVASWLTTIFEILMFSVCIGLLVKSRVDGFSSWVHRRLIAGFALLIGLEAFDMLIEYQAESLQIQWLPWLTAGVAIGFLQIIASFERNDLSNSQLINKEEGEKEAAEGRFNALAHNSRDMVIEINSEGRLSYISPNIEKVMKLPADQLVGLNILELVAQIELRSEHEQVQPDFNLPLSEIVKSGPFGTTYKMVDGDGVQRWIEADASDYVGPGGKLKAIGVVRDVTERHKLEEQMVRGLKLESLGVLAAGVAHDFNNLLTSVLGEIELSRMALQRHETLGLEARLDRCIDSVMKAKALTGQLMTYAGKGTPSPSTIDVAKELTALQPLFHASLEDTMIFSMEFKADALPIQIDRVQLQQIAMNFLSNAKEACDGKGSVTIEVFHADVVPDDHQKEVEAKGPFTALRVTDNGKGMPSKIMAKVFDPFFSTKFDGRGLGLASVFGIVKMYGGTVTVESEEGEGSTFTVYLPASFDEVNQQSELSVEPKAVAQKTILVVDDSPSPLSYTQQALENYQYRVLIANDGDEAIRIARQVSSIDLVLMDLAMPGLSGADLIRGLREQLGNIPVVIMSGYNESFAHQKLEDIKVAGFLQKPFMVSELLASVEVGLTTHAEDN